MLSRHSHGQLLLNQHQNSTSQFLHFNHKEPMEPTG